MIRCCSRLTNLPRSFYGILICHNVVMPMTLTRGHVAAWRLLRRAGDGAVLWTVEEH